MAEYIDRKAAIKQLRDVYEYDFPTASGVFDEFATKIVPRVLKSIPAADVVPASQERIYKDLLDALLEDVQNLKTTLSDACCMCTKGECDDCNLRTFEEELSAIIERAAKRKKRLTD